MEADFALFIRDALHSDDEWVIWFPETLVHSYTMHGPFEVFVRSRSSSYFENVKKMLGIDSKQELEDLMTAFSEQRQRVPTFGRHGINPYSMLGLKDIDTKP